MVFRSTSIRWLLSKQKSFRRIAAFPVMKWHSTTSGIFLMDLIERIIADKRAKKAPVAAKIDTEEPQKEEGVDHE